ncbi:N-acetyltransferase [Deinococcus cavernae]|uniref:N-acetyltransferase n=1 Tax=Deinococcus cavernae TaxID=2320857 RepID=A0A418V9M0_9DEIO|nr:GNAT family protein [Deinococcus cavernae]RJF72811.1 N-acetyltransferase [Deinococcus cavernae]
MTKLALRPRQDADLPTLWRWVHGEENPEWMRWDGPYFASKPQPMSYEAYLEKAQTVAHSPDRQIIALNGECIGMVTRYEEAPAGGGWWELGIVIYDPQHWGGGLGREALRQWTARTFQETDAHVITLTTWSGNERLIRSAQSAGYHECARIPEARHWQGRRWDSVKLALLRRDWPQQ